MADAGQLEAAHAPEGMLRALSIFQQRNRRCDLYPWRDEHVRLLLASSHLFEYDDAEVAPVLQGVLQYRPRHKPGARALPPPDSQPRSLTAGLRQALHRLAVEDQHRFELVSACDGQEPDPQHAACTAFQDAVRALEIMFSCTQVPRTRRTITLTKLAARGAMPKLPILVRHGRLSIVPGTIVFRRFLFLHADARMDRPEPPDRQFLMLFTLHAGIPCLYDLITNRFCFRRGMTARLDSFVQLPEVAVAEQLDF